ncbi:MAG: peptidylprolyl isomerase [Candidatus Anaerobiospirillum merdipullorum]|uniref:Chaperone SurA n=1 Tax=Candidatus Anaerobiospirillum merdipullorum TaxID=2838450 RepID=A0A9E2NU11_9GAMM|nr:peptidylprolyl isomerase [Candidatus Anaerobiospirillum merdipullorum]
MKKFTRNLALALSLLLGASAVPAAEESLDSAAAIVNNDIILESELDKASSTLARNFQRRGQAVDEVSARKAALEALITRSLVLQLAQNQGITLTDMQLDTALAQTAAQRGISVQDLLASIAPGQSEAQAREQFRDELILTEVRRARIRARINVSDTEVDLLAQNLRKVGSVEPQYHLAQIIVPVENGNAVAANRTVAQIRAQLRDGADFNALAARYAIGSAASQAGDLGYLPETQVPVPFLPALLKAKPGDVIGPFRSPFGIHLLKLYDISHDAVEPISLYDASHILLQTSIIFSDKAARNELATLKQQIESGQLSFAEAARRYSQDPGSAINGGDLGYATPGRYDPLFARAMVALRPGQISEPIKSSFGWHLIYLKDVKIDKDSDDAYRQKARDLIYRRLFQEESVSWERELRDSAYIHVMDPTLVNAHIDMDQTAQPGAR